ncbi:zinc finger transcriptional activator [Didymella glomerata]|uniref:Zinc finger transcriptional activator n=1 Tax=Didymella glomerata TaxID=749621 RepID=A0A9W9BVK8_9PLEO|nr:zinc finger transcriptional activator [Didymella glomerata]
MSGSNASPPRAAQSSHTRTYQACIPCRRRKVRCDLGPVDNPHDPPCVRCRRESKECFFSATRRKRKQDGEDEVDEVDDYEVRNARKRSRPSEVEVLEVTTSNAAYVSQPLTPGGSIGRYEPLRRPTTSASMPPVEHSEEDIKVNNESVATLQTGEIYSGHDALNLLFEAARNGGMDMHHRTASASSMQRPALGSTPGSNFAGSPQVTAPHIRSSSRAAADNVDPAIAQPPPPPPPPQPQPQPPVLPDPPNEAAFSDAIHAWTRFRFVRAGWLTAKEAIAYIDYFYAYLSPLTPIVVPDYRDHAYHGKLLKEEPMLVITLLTIASRYSQPSGTTNAGAASRAYLIHEKLWKYLQGMIDRMIFGQEQFGGGFCGAGQQPGSDVNPLSRKGLRTLGTVESLMLLTEWHPRALHFPPGDDDDELVLPDDLDLEEGPKADMYKGVGDKRIDSWLEPCWRSDRMCWMLLGNAMTLAFEIGVFDETSETEFEQANQHLSHATVKAYFRRKNHLKNLLIIYVTQTSGRLGLTSMLPKIDQRDESFVGGPTPNELYQQRVSGIKAPPMQFGTRPGAAQDGQRLPLESVAHQERHAVQDLVLDFWTRIAKVMEMGNLKLFSNRRKTRELLKSGQYEDMLKFFQAPLMEWKACFDRAPQVPTQLRHVLIIEFEYTRVYLNSLALQAVVERCTHNTPLQTHANLSTARTPTNGPSSGSGDGGAIPFSTLTKWYANDRHYINEVIDASRNVLKVVVEGLYPGDYLRHAPVRTFFRIVSVAIILLKTFALGATEEDVAVSLALLSGAVDALRTSIVDDVHVGNRFADLVETLTHRIRSRFVRLAANGSTGISRAGSRSPVSAPLMPPPAPLNPLAGSYMGSNSTVFPSQNPGYGTGTSVPGSPGLGLTASGRATPISQSLWGISAEPYDPNSNSISIMPPPGFNAFPHPSTPGGSNSNAGNANGAWSQWANSGASWGGSNNDQDWLALPLDPLLDQWGAEINQTAMGPDVGGMDMLDILLNMGGPPGSTS